MNRNEKAQLLSDLHELFNNSEVLIVSHYKGITVAEADKLRNAVREAGAGFRITKNRITRLALKGTKFEGLSDLFVGPTSVAFANDVLTATKVCVEFAKTNENFVVLGGGLGNQILTIDEIKTYASLPSLDELRAKIIGLVQAPAGKIARVLKAYSEK